jgi:MFS family permease
MGSINAVPSYTSYYNLPKEGNSGTGIVFAIFQIGQMTGAFFCWVSDWHGRRWPIFVGCVGTCVGAVVTSVAPTIPAFIGGRFLLSFFSTIATTAAPLYLIEIAPPQYRGTVAGMYNTLYYLVSVPSRYCCHSLTHSLCRDRLSQHLWFTRLKSAGETTATT